MIILPGQLEISMKRKLIMVFAVANFTLVLFLILHLEVLLLSPTDIAM